VTRIGIILLAAGLAVILIGFIVGIGNYYGLVIVIAGVATALIGMFKELQAHTFTPDKSYPF